MHHTRELLRRRRMYLAVVILSVLVALLPQPNPTAEHLRRAVQSIGAATRAALHPADPATTETP